MKRNTSRRDRDRAIIRREQPCCWICGEPIDYGLPHLDPLAYVVDHVIPLARGGTDELANKKAAHRQPSVQPCQRCATRRRTHHQTQ